MAQSAVQKQRMNYHYMADAMRRLEWDLHQRILTEGRLPEEWHAIAARRDEPARVRITLTVEEDVAKFFRGMGRNYQARMNEVLRAFMHARLAGLLRGGETMDYLAQRREAGLDGMKPGWGEAQKDLEELGEGVAQRMSDEAGVPIGEERRSERADAAAWLRGR